MSGYQIIVRGPDGEKVVVLTEEQVKFFKGAKGDPYSTAAWLAHCDLWVQAEAPELIE